MAAIMQLTEEQRKQWRAWVASRPECIQDLCRRFPPDRLYRLKSSGHRVTLYSYCEDGTMTVIVSGEYNAVAFGRNVFGIKPEDLEECDLPAPGELLGELTADPKEIDAILADTKEINAILAKRRERN
jgi:hypothetical protein